MGERHARGSLPIGRRLVAYQLGHARAYRSRAQERARNCQAVLYLERDRKPYVVASFGGSDRPPDWSLNLVANPEVTVERRWARGAYRARTLAPEEQQEMWPRPVAMYPAYEDYQKRSAWTVQLVELTPV